MSHLSCGLEIHISLGLCLHLAHDLDGISLAPHSWESNRTRIAIKILLTLPCSFWQSHRGLQGASHQEIVWTRKQDWEAMSSRTTLTGDVIAQLGKYQKTMDRFERARVGRVYCYSARYIIVFLPGIFTPGAITGFALTPVLAPFTPDATKSTSRELPYDRILPFLLPIHCSHLFDTLPSPFLSSSLHNFGITCIVLLGPRVVFDHRLLFVPSHVVQSPVYKRPRRGESVQRCFPPSFLSVPVVSGRFSSLVSSLFLTLGSGARVSGYSRRHGPPCRSVHFSNVYTLTRLFSL